MSRFLNEKLKELEPYVPGEQPLIKYIKLNTNENPYYPSRYAVERLDSGEVRDLRLYSDPQCRELNSAIAAYYGVNSENVITTNGSDEALAFCFSAFGGSGAVFPDVTYGFYKVFAGLYGVAYSEIPLRDDFTIDIAPYLACGKMVVFANPNAQTGLYMPLSDVEKIVGSNPDSVVVVDEAYVDFGGESAVKLIGKYENLVVVQTFSKSRSLAGARVGFAIACKQLIGDLNRVKFSFNPYNVNRLSSAAATAAMRDTEYFRECVNRIICSRERLLGGLSELGFYALPSKANFVLAKCAGLGGEQLYLKLRERGVLVRYLGDERIKDFVRITVGTEEQVETLLKLLEEIKNESV